MKPAVSEQSQVLGELAIFYQWLDVAIIYTEFKTPPQILELMRRIQRKKPLLTIKTASINITNISEIKNTLFDIKTSTTSLVVLYSSVTNAKVVLQTAEKLKLFDGKIAWFLTDSLVDDTTLLPWIPIGMMGMRIHSVNEASLIRDLIHDSLIVTAHAQSLHLRINVANKIMPNCYGETNNGSGNSDFLRYV